MADRYWVGGAGTWDATTTTNWSATSGGTGGASAPTSADNAIFNTLSNATAYAVTVGTNAVCADVTIAGPLAGNVTITSGATAVINVYGSWTSAATGVTFTTTTGAVINFLATTTGKTVTTNNVTLGQMAVVFNGVGGGWTLGSALTCTQVITVTAGAFSTGNFAVNGAGLSSSGTGVRSVTLGTSTLTVTGGAGAWAFTTTTSLTFSGASSTVVLSGAGPTFAGGGLTYNIVNFTSTATGTSTITGANTFATLNQSSNVTNIRILVISANQTVTGTLTLGAANTAVLRVLVRSDAIGTQRTLTVGTIATLADVDFQDIVAAGASGTWSGTRLGNCTNNSNITFGAGKTVYWNLAGAQNWSATGWATSSGGAPAVNNFPLAQDTAVFDNTGSVTGIITIQTGWNLPAINITKTGAMTIANGTQTPRIFGGVTLQAATVTTGTGAWTYAAYGVTSTFTSNTATFTPSLVINALTGGITLGDGFTAPSTVTNVLTAGTLSLVSYTLTMGLFSSTSATTRTLAFGTGKIVITGSSATVFSTNTGTSLTITGSKRVEYTYSGSVGTRFISGPTTATAVPGTNTCSHYITAGTDIVSPNGARAYDTVDCTGFGGTLTSSNMATYGDLVLSAVSTFSTSSLVINFGSTSGTKTITSNGKSIDGGITFSGIGGAWQLQDNLTLLGSTYTATLTNGTLDLNGYTLTAGTFGSSNSNTRTLAFGTGKIVLTGNATTVWSNGTTSGLTVTGTPLVQATYSGSTGTRVFSALYNSEATSISLEVTAGSDSISLSSSSSFYKNVSLVGFTGAYASTGTTVFVYGNWNWGGVTLVSSSTAHTFSSTSGTKTITSNGVSFGAAVSFTGVGGAWTCVDTLGVVGALTMTNGTLKLKSGVTSTVGSFVTSGTTMKYLQSSTAGTQATISDASGTNTVSYLTIQDSNATGGALWLAPFASNNVYGGNNTGWLFGTQYASTIVEASSLADTVNPSNQISASISESTILADAASSAFLWNLIDDTQVPNWQNVSNPQTPNWQNIDNS